MWIGSFLAERKIRINPAISIIGRSIPATAPATMLSVSVRNPASNVRSKMATNFAIDGAFISRPVGVKLTSPGRPLVPYLKNAYFSVGKV